MMVGMGSSLEVDYILTGVLMPSSYTFSDTDNNTVLDNFTETLYELDIVSYDDEITMFYELLQYWWDNEHEY